MSQNLIFGTGGSFNSAVKQSYSDGVRGAAAPSAFIRSAKALTMRYLRRVDRIGNWLLQPAASISLPYGLAVVSVAAALGLAQTFLRFHLPQPFTAFALSAIAITFWYGGTMPGILAAVLSSLVRTYFFAPEANALSRLLYDLVFLVFALLMTQGTRARDQLEAKVAERTADLTRANEELKIEIAERKLAEEALRRSEGYLAEAQRLSRTGSWASKPAMGEISYLSEECYRVLGFDPRGGEPSYEAFFQRIHPDDRARVSEGVETAGREKAEFELDYRIVDPGGETRTIHVVGHPVFTSSGDLVEFVGTVMDVTERKLAEEALRRSEGYLAEAQRLSQTGSWASTVGEIRYLSEECYRVLGFDPRGGQPLYETFFQRIHSDDQAKFREAVETANCEKADFELDYRFVHPRGELRDIHVIGHPVLGPSGDLVEFVGTVMDVTERKRADEERERLRQAQADLAYMNRVTTMSELAASLAHEIKQPIAAAVTDANTCLRWLSREHPDIEEARQTAARMVKDATRAAEIISRIRLLFKKGTLERELVDVNEVIREMIVLLGSDATRYSISVRTELAPDLPQITADRVQLQQVIMNLITNGVDAMREVEGPRELAIKSRRAENEQLLLSVSDTGVGLPPQKDQIFNAVFTTKVHGTGMGLAISRSIVESHGGRLWAGDNSPRGANFCLTLPATTEAHE